MLNKIKRFLNLIKKYDVLLKIKKGICGLIKRKITSRTHSTSVTKNCRLNRYTYIDKEYYFH